MYGKGKDNSTEAFRGQISHFTLWRSVISDTEIKAFNDCRSDQRLRSPLISWENVVSNLILNGSAEVIQVEKVKVCRQNGKFRALLSPPLNFAVAESICKTLQGVLIVNGTIKNESGSQFKLLAQERNSKDVDKPRLDKWNQATKMLGKSRNSPSGIHLKRTKRQTTSEIDPGFGNHTELEFTAVCEFAKPPVIKASGFCPDLLDLLDEYYVVQSWGDERPLFQGFTGKSITYARGIWIAQSPLR